MRRLCCNSCGHIYQHNQSGLPSCPRCGSGSYHELEDENAMPWWRHTSTWIALLVLLLMIITLFILPHKSKEYMVKISINPGQNGFSLQVLRDTTLMPPDSFSYSADDGKKWQDNNTFGELARGSYQIKLRHKITENADFEYDFAQPIMLEPTISADPCDCKTLKINNVRIQSKNAKKYIVISAEKKACGLEYSVTGLQGDYTADSIMAIGGKTEFLIYVRTSRCQPVAYEGNPFRISAEPAEAKTTEGPKTLPADRILKEMANVLKDGDKDKIRDFMQKYFSSEANVNDASDNSATPVKRYLNSKRKESWKFVHISHKTDQQGKITVLFVKGTRLD